MIDNVTINARVQGSRNQGITIGWISVHIIFNNLLTEFFIPISVNLGYAGLAVLVPMEECFYQSTQNGSNELEVETHLNILGSL